MQSERLGFRDYFNFCGFVKNTFYPENCDKFKDQ